MNKIFKALEARSGEHPGDFRQRHIAGIFRGRHLIAVGFNQRKSHPLQKKWGRNVDSIYLHAETDAICSALRVVAPEELRYLTLGVIRLKGGQLVNSRPCAGCCRAIAQFDIRRVIHS